MKGLANFGLIVPVDARQRQLSEHWLTPKMPDLLMGINSLRLAIDLAVERLRTPITKGDRLRMDDLLIKLVRNEFSKGHSALKCYPVGCCVQITRVAYNYLHEPLNEPNGRFTCLHHFIEEGGIFNIIWGSVHDRYFQTALQIGPYYVDIANDTVDINKPKLDWAELSSSPFRNIETIGEYARIKTAYHRVGLYWNNFIPAAFPYCPLVEIDTNCRQVRLLKVKFPILHAICGSFMTTFRDFGLVDCIQYPNLDLIRALHLPATSGEVLGNKVELRCMEHSEILARLRQEEKASQIERHKSYVVVQRLAGYINLLWMQSKAFEKHEQQGF